MCVLIFSTSFFFRNISHSEKNSARRYYICTYVVMYSTRYICTCVVLYSTRYICTYVVIYSTRYICTYVVMYITRYICTYVVLYSTRYICTYVVMYSTRYICTYVVMYSTSYSRNNLIKLEFSRRIWKKNSSDIKFRENSSNRSRVVPCGQTDTQTWQR